MRTLLIINPISGRKAAHGFVFDIINHFSEHDVELTVITTRKPGDGTIIVQTKGENYDLVVCAGGDGTLNEVVVGLMRLKNPPRLGYIPAGTTNDFARSLRLPTDAKKATEIIIHGQPKSLDIGTFQDTHFIYSASFGFMTEVAYVTEQSKKNKLGRLAYILEGSKHILDHKSYQLSIDYEDGHLEGEYAFGAITNTYSLGGIIKYSPDQVDLSDGLFEVMLFKAPSSPLVLQQTFMKLINKNIDERYIDVFKARKISISSTSPINWCIDGEDGGCHNTVEITNRCRSIDIMCPMTECNHE